MKIYRCYRCRYKFVNFDDFKLHMNFCNVIYRNSLINNDVKLKSVRNPIYKNKPKTW